MVLNSLLILLLLIQPAHATTWRHGYVDYTKDSSCVGAWRFNDDLHTTAIDISGTGNNGVVTSATYGSGKEGNGWNFNAGADVIEIPDDATLDTVTDLTIVCWVKSDGAWSTGESFVRKDGMYICRKGRNPGTDDNNVAIIWFDGARVRYVQTSADPPTDTWFHIAFQAQSNAPYKVYINGVDSGGANTDWFGSARTLTNSLKFSTAEPFDGDLDEVAIFNRVLTQAEIIDIMNNGLK